MIDILGEQLELTSRRVWNRYERGLTAALTAVLLGGWVLTQASAASEVSERRTVLAVRAATVAAMIPVALVERLTGSQSDAATDGYEDVQALLRSVCTSRQDVDSVAIVARRGSAFFYLAHAVSDRRSRSGDQSARPGEAYRFPADSVADLLLAGETGDHGRHVHDYGTTISSLVPIRQSSGQVVAAIDLQVDPAGQRRAVARARLAPISVTLLTSVLLVAFFMSERKMAESAARTVASERRYRGLVEGSPNGIMLLDREGRCLTINHNGLGLFSLAEEDVVGRRLSELWPAAERPAIAAASDRVSRGDRVTLDTRYSRPDGSSIALELVLNAETDGAGSVTHLVGSVTDITQRHRAQIALERSHRFTQVILAISARFLGLRTERVDAATRDALREVGAFLEVDRAQLFHLSVDRAAFSLTHEWCAPMASSRLPALQAARIDDYPWTWATLEKTGVVRVPDVDAMPDEASAERAGMQAQRIGAYLCVPVNRRGSVTGFLALDVFNRRRDWPDDEVTLLRIAADVLSNGLARKQADEALRESEQRFQKAFSNNPAAMAILWMENQRIVEANEAFLQLLASPREGVIGRTVDDLHLIVDEDAQEVFARSLAREEPLRAVELRVRTANGELRDVSLSMDAFELAGQRFMLAVALDLSARTRAEEALREREEVFRSISATAQDGIIMIDPDARVTVWNDAAERMFGYTREEAQGQTLHALILPEEHEPGFLSGFAQFRVTGEGPFVGPAQQIFGRRKDGTRIPVELSASAVRVRGRWHAVGILRDITDRLKVEEALWKAKEETEEANTELQRSVERANRLAEEAAVANVSKSEFLANMSHEIRTPMNGIIGMSGLLLDTRLSAEQREYAETVRTCADSLLTIINDILDFSKIEAGKLDIEMLDFELAGTLADTMDVLAMRAHQKGLEMACLIAPDVPGLLRGDPGRLRQVLTNLLGNAVKFTDRGEVTLSVSVETLTAEDALLRFIVHDTGIGIPAHKLGALFQPFTQVDSSTTRNFGGTGLGLSISRRLAKMMGGTVGVESEEGVGSSFSFTARFERQLHAPPAVAVSEDALEGVRVLGQDNNLTNRRVLSGILESRKCRHTEVDSGAAALAHLRAAARTNDPYRIAILDMVTKDIPGEDLGRQIKADSLIAGTTLVMMTSVGRRGDVSRFREAGFSGYLTKPVKASHLLSLLATLTGRPADQAEGEPPLVTRHTIAEAQRRKTRILLAEDNITNQMVAIKVLEKMGHRVEAVANGAEAVKVLCAMPYDLVLMDVQMPEMDGFEATRRIRDAASGVRNPRIPIIAMTAHAMKGDRERCLEAGMDDYLTKPINPKEVAEAISRWTAAETPADTVAETPADTAAETPARTDADTAVNTTPEAEGRAPAPAAAPAALAPAALDRLTLLNRLGGDEDVFMEVIQIFIEDVPRQLTGIDEALAAGDAPTLRRLAHSLKGSSGTAGAEALQHASQALEQAAAAGDLRAATLLVQPVKDMFALVLETMSRWLVEGKAR